MTIHASSQFSSRHLESGLDDAAALLLDAASAWLISSVRSYQIHRWRYSLPSRFHTAPCLALSDGRPLVFAGDAFVAPRVEGAALSGLAAAEALLSMTAPAVTASCGKE